MWGGNEKCERNGGRRRIRSAKADPRRRIWALALRRDRRAVRQIQGGKMRYRRFMTANVMATFGFVAHAQTQTKIKFDHVDESGSLLDQSATEFARRANEKLGDKAKVVAYGSSQLGNDTAMLQKLKLGTVDLALPTTVMSSMVPVF